jgi:hypothetical protein
MLTTPKKYPNQVDWADYKTMPDYREGWRDPHKSGIVELGRALDVTTYIPGLNQVSNAWHDAEQEGTTAGNRILSPVVGFLQDGQDKMLPYHKELHHAVGLDGIDRFIREKPVDAAGIAAATYFTAGAASGAASPAGGAGMSAGQTAAAANAITPALQSGAYGVSAAAAPGTAGSAMGAAITPAFESAAGAALAPTAFTYGGLGATGYAAGVNALTPSAAGYGSLLSGAKNAYNKFNTVDSYRSNIKRFADQQGPTDQERYNAQAAAIGDRILNAGNNPTSTRDKIKSQIMMNRWGMR